MIKDNKTNRLSYNEAKDVIHQLSIDNNKRLNLSSNR